MASVQDLSSRYGAQLRQLKSIFPTWDEGDLAFTLQDAKGNVDEAAMMITEGESIVTLVSSLQESQADPVPSLLSTRSPIPLHLCRLTHLPAHRPSIAVHRSNHKEEERQASTQGHQPKTLEP